MKYLGISAIMESADKTGYYRVRCRNKKGSAFKMNNIAYCGLACCVCSENDKCTGCQAGGCDIHGWCKNYNCCREKGLNGCWECGEFPCKGGMLDKLRIRAFARYVKECGVENLTECLLRNKENGAVYHYDGMLEGDYDSCPDEEAIIEMIKNYKPGRKQYD